MSITMDFIVYVYWTTTSSRNCSFTFLGGFKIPYHSVKFWMLISSQHLPNMEKVWSIEESFTPETCLITQIMNQKGNNGGENTYLQNLSSGEWWRPFRTYISPTIVCGAMDLDSSLTSLRTQNLPTNVCLVCSDRAKDQPCGPSIITC